MVLRISDYVLIGIIALIGIGITAYYTYHYFYYKKKHEEKKKEFAATTYYQDDIKHHFKGIIISLSVTLIICIGYILIASWFYKNTASGQRAYKDFTSNVNIGLEREITITAEDGREIFHYEGKIDIETDHTGDSNYILFETEEGKRIIIYYGITDTIIIKEK